LIQAYDTEFNHTVNIPKALKPLPPSDAVWKQRFILEDLFSLVLSQFKNLSRLWKPEILYLGISQSLKLLNFMVKILRIYLKLNFAPNILWAVMG